MTSFLVTGANGFVGKALCKELVHRKVPVRGSVRELLSSVERPIFDLVAVGDVGADTAWTEALHGVDVVIHLAARVHVMRENAADPLAAFREVNVAGTECLARAAASGGVRRMVYVSSIKVNGEQTSAIPFAETEAPAPQDPYGISKYEAELALHNVAKETGLEVVIVRPPLVYGPGVGGNFLRLLKLVSKGVPLPLASIQNQRSMVYLDNFVDVLIMCATHQAAAGKTYLVSDGDDISTPLLIYSIANLMGKHSRLWPLPSTLLKLAGVMTGRLHEVERLIGSLQVDSSKICNELEWVPPYTVQQGLCETVNWYVNLSVPK
ncbi:UDP-glucose 4-epimerase family protein [Sulfuriferula nivalis]|uniref:UDP-glucose 4-epimerase n=1 Tax=Sulfuriferula nivalis TaxID=2675298 RepID=A0A809S824_9PROT|nr:SDR family oxidoreductase [Sulfuriferula nivalis]BBO99941.1 UDP-glucose 4-epimerase [Sulfuriferula nivalis]